MNQFYKNQFLFLKSSVENIPTAYFEREAQKITEQVGRPFETVLELGAGMGNIANQLSLLGKEVTTIELVKELTEHAQKHCDEKITIICGDFYTINIGQQFDLLLYLDGFGVGNDEDQLRLLKRIYNWLSDDGYALIDIYEPNYWRDVYKEEMRPSEDTKIIRQYSFDEESSRLLDTWWHMDAKNNKYTQSLACYTAEEIYDMCQQANLEIVAYYPNGAMNYKTWAYYDIAPLHHCISYRIKIRKK
ncbi:class I SAM-dependent methyltransferase [Metasolibacillus meyeri]|uniref:class I SAM-dependent methyltransferase n=1 Tax=Metasolibacillus meyeri TaxID=1071052 RepID=UPI001EE771E7|nr:class I SAM-dependent methyltransferase [Metasolibacillus meyeri]